MALINLQTNKPKLNVSNINSPFGSGASIPKISAGAGSFINRPSAGIKPGKVLNIDEDQLSFNVGLADDVATNRNNIFTNRSNIGNHEKRISMLSGGVSTLNEELSEITAIISDIGGALSLDFANRITEQKKENKELKSQVSADKRSSAESNLEGKKKIGKGIGSGITGLASKTGSALGLDKILEVGKLLAAGIAINAIIPNLGKIFGFVEKNFKTILLVGGALVGLNLLSGLGGLLAFGSLFTNPAFLAAIATVVGIASAAAMQGLGKNEKAAMKDLEEMGGPTLENRKKLAERYRQTIKNDMPFGSQGALFGKRGELENRIKFLEDGTIGGNNSKKYTFEDVLPFGLNYNMGPNRGKFDFDQEKFDKGILDLSQKPKVNLIEMDLPPITVPSNKTAKNIALPETTQVPYASSVNSANKHMTKTPEIHGIIG